MVRFLVNCLSYCLESGFLSPVDSLILVYEALSEQCYVQDIVLDWKHRRDIGAYHRG